MRKLLTLIATMIMCNAYGEDVYWVTGDTYSTATCNSGDNITKPADPEKEGYRFIGWKEGTTPADVVPIPGKSQTPNALGYGVVNWTVTFPYGEITGEWMCSDTSGTAGYNSATMPPSTAAAISFQSGACGTNRNPSCPNIGTYTKYCWCKLTNFVGTDVSSVAWVLARSDFSSGDWCAQGCALNCANGAKGASSLFRKVLFTIN